ncbi:F-box domain-containing protein [Caenorhabditis elegans]|uniref:F-box domain-containing protein n=1 Tax=Caenorhabditis elegans TaxID=6239 RepID=A0A2C9C3H4_CAEEL|nr:F-box domain-containing protein [Caenorhabditis elegans]SOF58826.1 F-box domain-containing protein [Caenorhabditis elegans]|eukprot:NP_001343828.1 Uncharacterized protein CELE_C53A3.1 [Caenorhabditis elegans]
MKPFVVNSLPYPAFRKFLQHLDIDEVIKLARVSHKTQLKVKRINRKVFKLILDNRVFEKNGGPARIERLSRHVMIIETSDEVINAYEAMNNYLAKYYPAHKWSHSICHHSFWIDELRRLVNFRTDPHTYYNFNFIPYDEPKQLMKVMTFLNETLSIDHVEIMMDHDKLFGDYKCILESPLLRKCNSLEILGRNLRLWTYQLKLLLEKIQPTHRLSIECMLSSHFNKELTFNIPYLELFNLTQLGLHEVQNMNCELIRLRRAVHHLKLNKSIHYSNIG